MLNIFLKTVFIYALLVLFLRLMGKRQIGELQISELIITFLLSEIASTPIMNPEVSLLSALVPVLTLISLEIIISFLTTRSDLLKRIFDGVPSVIISKGVLNIKELDKLRITINEFISQLRQLDISSVDEVEYAILEQNGKLSVAKKAKYQPLTREDLGLSVKEKGIAHPVIVDGRINKGSLSFAEKDINWLNKKAKESKLSLDEIFLMTADDSGDTFIIKKEKRGSKQ